MRSAETPAHDDHPSTPTGKPIGRTILRDEIKRLVAERILDGTYKPGSRIVESQLAREFGTSQAPVREALRDLEGMHLIESIPHKGARVREQDPQRLLDSYPVRAALEELAAREAARAITDGQLQALDAEVRAMEAAAAMNDVKTLLAHDMRFHEIILEAAGNQVLLEAWRALQVESGTFISTISTDWDLAKIAQMHRPVFEAFAARDPQAAARQLKEHIGYFAARVRKDPKLFGRSRGDRP